jgi:hypothetical protein
MTVEAGSCLEEASREREPDPVGRGVDLEWAADRQDVPWSADCPMAKPSSFRRESRDQRIPVFRADMTAQDLTSMVEVSYRVNGVTVFNLESVERSIFSRPPASGCDTNYTSASDRQEGQLRAACDR